MFEDEIERAKQGNTCNKVRHYSKRAAKRAAKSIRSAGCKDKLSIYLCEDCGYYHLTSADYKARKYFRTKDND